ncbi:ester cyclase [Labedaea rhizosphaerae]|uniref:Steroid delta-isomerase-like uncharacterized protein n=1 Tax=Labedaea rhizosphaerae TaxID=598644 RepID=A0A4R6S6J9_LABRH|nr:ester cyclase [Labedaea rhizosphaerae]TDP94973.1 steroid delta-isomerase-like uncharacterized protein [Labedaea rhizosphaerae]
MYKRLHDAINTNDHDLIMKTIEEVMRPDVVISTPLPIKATGVDAFKEVFTVLGKAFPDLHIAVEDEIREGDKVACRTKVTGTHLGEYLGVAPTGKTITYNEIFIFRLVDERIAQTWGVVDFAAQLRQLGLLQFPPA